MKVGADLDDDVRRIRIIREEIGPDRMLVVDANQLWDVGEAIDWMARLAPFDPYWIEEPTSPDDILGHAAIARAVAPDPGRHRRARPQPDHVQAVPGGRGDAASARSTPAGSAASTRSSRCCCWPPSSACRSARTPAASGCASSSSTSSVFDYIAVSGALDGRMIEYVDHLHEHFVDPVVIRDGALPCCPTTPGYSAEMQPESLAALPLSRTAPRGA